MISYKPLLKLLIDRDVQKYDLVDKKLMSSATLAKITKGEYISLKIVDDLCNHFNCDVSDIIEHVKG